MVNRNIYDVRRAIDDGRICDMLAVFRCSHPFLFHGQSDATGEQCLHQPDGEIRVRPWYGCNERDELVRLINFCCGGIG